MLPVCFLKAPASLLAAILTIALGIGANTALRSVVQDVAPSVPSIQIHTMAGLVDDTLQTDRFIQQLSSAFGVLAIVLASVGLYGVLAYNVARRTREIGIHMALGAAPANIRWQVLRESLLLAIVGIGIGVPVALAGTRLIRSLLFGLGLIDPVVLTSAATLLVVVAGLAGFLPARRASRVDPMVALRYE